MSVLTGSPFDGDRMLERLGKQIGVPIDADAIRKVADEQLRMILDASRALAVTTDLDKLLCRLAEIATQMLACERASIFLHEKSRGELWTKVALGSAEIRLPAHAGIARITASRNPWRHSSSTRCR